MIKDKKQKNATISWSWKDEIREWITGIVIGFVLGPVLFHFLKFMNEPMLKWFEFITVACFYRMVIRKKNFYLPAEAKEWFEVIVFAGFLALNIRAFVVQAYKIPSGSMIPTLQIKDHLFVSKFNYWFKMPRAGEIVVFKFPEDPKKDFIKRVIAAEGDTVQIVSKQVFVNGKQLAEPYAVHYDPLVIPGMPRDNFGPVMVPKGHLFVMGDNRDNSNDCRYWGFLPKENLKGKALLLYWPFSRIRLIK